MCDKTQGVEIESYWRTGIVRRYEMGSSHLVNIRNADQMGKTYHLSFRDVEDHWMKGQAKCPNTEIQVGVWSETWIDRKRETFSGLKWVYWSCEYKKS